MTAEDLLKEIKNDFLDGEFTADKSVAVDLIDELEGKDEMPSQD